uniref:Uncharacterized protein n=1 Tax=Setaria viridis TaxID=4556 RepID=A0A4U6T469_SETVI|nr:hypothetical protein SEVIR_9G428350v2 [Setaria viridis]
MIESPCPTSELSPVPQWCRAVLVAYLRWSFPLLLRQDSIWKDQLEFPLRASESCLVGFQPISFQPA